MPVKPIFGSYPYLTIAKKYNVDYGDVLMCGEFYLRDCETLIGREPYERIQQKLGEEKGDDFLIDVLNADLNFRNIKKMGWDQS